MFNQKDRFPFVIFLEFLEKLPPDRRARLMEIATKCPVHRVIEYPAFFVDVENWLEAEDEVAAE